MLNKISSTLFSCSLLLFSTLFNFLSNSFIFSSLFWISTCFFNEFSFNLTKESSKYLSSKFLSSANLFLIKVISLVFGIIYGVTITTKLFFLLFEILFLKSSPNKGTSPKTGTFWFVVSTLFSINPPIITLSPLFKIALVFTSFFKYLHFH